jgi:RluA family pseudouridine synthase
VNAAIKLSSPATQDFWELPVLFEDAHVLALDKPAGLLTSPDRFDPERPSLMKLLHAGIAAGKPWAREHQLTYLSNAHRLDADTSGIILLAKSKPVLVALADLFGSEKPARRYVTLVYGAALGDEFSVDAKLSPHPARPGEMRVDPKCGKRSKTHFKVLERFAGLTLLQCELLTNRAHQIRVHLRHAGLRVVADSIYGGGPLLLSRLKKNYRLKEGKVERPLISRVALHAEQLTLPHPITGETMAITAPWPKELKVAVKYLREFASPHM